MRIALGSNRRRAAIILGLAGLLAVSGIAFLMKPSGVTKVKNLNELPQYPRANSVNWIEPKLGNGLSRGDQMQRLSFVTTDNPHQVRAYYDDMLTQEGWTIRNTPGWNSWIESDINMKLPYYSRSEHIGTAFVFTAFQGPFFGAPWVRLHIADRLYGLYVDTEVYDNGPTDVALEMVFETPVRFVPEP